MQSSTLADLQAMLQQAIELEHSTIPPYLTANFTLFSTTGANAAISEIIGSVLGEEMLHMTIAGNVLNAIGGSPVINKPGFIPTYPGPLPGGVEGGLTVGLEKFSINLVKNVFMEIEAPENQAPVAGGIPVPPDGQTIGEFYNGIISLMTNLETQAQANGSSIFTGSAGNQVTFAEFYPANVLFPVTSLQTAISAINIIIDQGEGSTQTPFVDPANTEGTPEPAHFYRFEEIVQGKGLVVNTSTIPNTYSYTGTPIPFDPTQVPNMWPNPTMSEFPKGSIAYENCRLFNYNYTSLLNCLHDTFNGHPEKLSTALGIMFSLRLYALKLLAQPHPLHPGFMAGPSFEYLDSL